MIFTDRKFYIVLAISLVVVVSIMWVIISMIDKDMKRKKSGAIFINRSSRKRRSSLLALYQFFSRFPFTKGYLHRISRRYEMICPGEKKEIEKKSILLALVIWCISGCILVFIFIKNPSVYTGAISLLLLFAVNAELIHFVVRTLEIKILKQLDKFLSDVRHFYYVKGAADDAIQESIKLAGKEMKTHASKIYEILVAENIEDEVMKYNETTHNNYLKMFLAQCVAVMNYGDKIVKDESLFLTNIKNLKVDIGIEIIKLNKINYLFSGLIAVTIAPILFLEFIQDWAVSNLPELDSFYNGMYGIILMVAIFIITVVVYIMVNNLREIKSIISKDYSFLESVTNFKLFKMALDNYSEKNYGKMEQQSEMLKKMGESITAKQLFIQRILYGFITLIFGILLFVTIHATSRNNLVYKIDNVEQLTTAANADQKDQMTIIIQEYVDKYKKAVGVTVEQMEAEITNSKQFTNNLIISSLAEEIIERIDQYKIEFFRWYEFLITLIFSYIAYCFPYWMILYRNKIMQMSMVDEVIQFQSIILMLMYIDRMTVSKILEFMESFAVIFKDSLRICINDYDSGDMDALENLKVKERFEQFQRLIDDFLMSDKIGLEKAFDEIVVDRLNIVENRKQENEINLNNKALIAKAISFIPIILVIGLYLIVPFIGESLGQLMKYNEEMKLL